MTDDAKQMLLYLDRCRREGREPNNGALDMPQLSAAAAIKELSELGLVGGEQPGQFDARGNRLCGVVINTPRGALRCRLPADHVGDHVQ